MNKNDIAGGNYIATNNDIIVGSDFLHMLKNMNICITHRNI